MRVFRSSGHLAFYRESLREDEKVESVLGIEHSVEEGSPQTRKEKKIISDHQSFGEDLTART